MASLNVKPFVQLVQDQAAAIQTRAKALVDFTVGSILRAVTEANASVALWLQGLVLQVLALTRLATSSGADVDSWVGDWGVTRLAATLSSGSVTFSRYVPTNSALVPLGAGVQTADGTQDFAVVLDATNSVWNDAMQGYLTPVGVSSVTVPVRALTGSSSANVVAGAVNTMTTAIVGIDYVTNALAFTGGSDSESDAALRARFVLFIKSLREGTVGAILYAITSLQLGLQATVIENETPDGQDSPGYLTITVDDGSGAPPTSTIQAAQGAVEVTRAGGIPYGVFGPIIIPAAIAVVVDTASGFDHNTVVGLVNAAVMTFINTLPLGTSLPYLKLAQVVYEASPGVVTIPTLTINGDIVDLAASARNVIKISTLTVA